ncbi:Uncharacterized protein cmbei_30060 [Cryptosporidium meleagridis]
MLKKESKIQNCGAHKITSKKMDLHEKNIEQSSFEVNKRAGFSFKKLFFQNILEARKIATILYYKKKKE